MKNISNHFFFFFFFVHVSNSFFVVWFIKFYVLCSEKISGFDLLFPCFLFYFVDFTPMSILLSFIPLCEALLIASPVFHPSIHPSD